ncbi:hypothetical protein CC1G_09606 [Coprinopsis cinerea okayama7|uniref:Uncharacterized protein n=1 Tax=Coprinopsis cinerea (strain Okayama-7 / 130 / ATCC MYA-4618 / FGSC 9003) TaxID=240176 RepID=A8N4C2_COPC7|nr:hypothetical protein CC1G_09606 [Coprinopsis cinerea okayama7\|eukprot:XP_001829717.2 hypothetical protein CC1G_09606 [Coprinopsis cinerea okayama7\
MPLSLNDLLYQPTPERPAPSPVTSPSASSRIGTSTSRSSSPDSDSEHVMPQVGGSGTATTSRKRPYEDYTTFATQAARNVRLRPGSEGEKAVVQFAKLSSPAQRIALYANLQSMSEHLHTINPADAMYEIPSKLVHRIDRSAFLTLISPTCSRYLKQRGPLGMILEHLEAHPSWGLTTAIKEDKSKYDIIVKKIQKALTNRRNAIKSTLKASLEIIAPEDRATNDKTGKTDIVQLTDNILSGGDSLVVRRPAATLAMLARFAYLRGLYVDSIEKPKEEPELVKDFWKGVDMKLQEVREVKETEQRLSSYFAGVLELDFARWGDIDRTGISTATFDPLANDDAAN